MPEEINRVEVPHKFSFICQSMTLAVAGREKMAIPIQNLAVAVVRYLIKKIETSNLKT